MTSINLHLNTARQQILNEDYRGAILTAGSVQPDSPEYPDALALQHQADLLRVLAEMAEDAGNQERLMKLQPEFSEALLNARNDSWLKSPKNKAEKADFERMLQAVGRAFLQLKVNGRYAFLEKYTKELQSIDHGEIDAFYKEADELWENWQLSITMNVKDAELVIRENVAREQFKRVSHLVQESPENRDVQELFQKATEDYKDAQGVINREVEKHRTALAGAQASREWTAMRYHANLILAFRPGDRSAKAAKAEAVKYMNLADAAVGQAGDLADLISKGEIESAQTRLGELLKPFPRGVPHPGLQILETLERYLSGFTPAWRGIDALAQQGRYAEAIKQVDARLEKVKRDISEQESDSEKDSPGNLNGFLDLLQGRRRTLQSESDKQQEIKQNEDDTCQSLETECQQAASSAAWRSLQSKIEKALPSLTLALCQERLQNLLGTVQEQLDKDVLEKAKAHHKSAKTHTALTSLERELEEYYGSQLQTSAGRSELEAIRLDVKRDLLLKKDSADELAHEAQRALNEGRLGTAERLLKSLHKKTIDVDTTEVRQEIIAQQAQLAAIRESRAVNPADGLNTLKQFLEAHPDHRDASLLFGELQFAALEQDWQQATDIKDLPESLEIARKALALRPGREEKTRWQSRKQESEQLSAQLSIARADFEAGRLAAALARFEDENLRTHSAEVDIYLAEIHSLETQLREAEESYQKGNYAESANQYQAVKKQINLSDVHQGNYEQARYLDEKQKGERQYEQHQSLDDAIRFLGMALDHAPGKKEADDVRSLLGQVRRVQGEVAAWEERARAALAEGKKFENRGDFTAALERYEEALGRESDEDILVWLDETLLAELTGAVDRVTELTTIKLEIEHAQNPRHTGKMIQAYEKWLTKRPGDAEAIKVLDDLRVIKKTQNRLHNEIKTIEGLAQIVKLESIREAREHLDRIRKQVIDHADALLMAEYQKVSQDVYKRFSDVQKYDGFMTEADEFLKRYEYDSAIQALEKSKEVQDT